MESDLHILNPGLELGEAAQNQIKGNPIDYYVEELHKSRNETIVQFKALRDEWLFEQTPFFGGNQANNYFKWFHVFEDELNHRGQIRIIKKMMKQKMPQG